MDYNFYSEIFKAIAHPVRLQILNGLMTHECNVNHIVENLSLPQSTVSQHLSILKNKGLIQPRKDGVKTCYQIKSQMIIDILRLMQK